MPKRHRVPGMHAVKQRAPLCSKCRTECIKNDADEWYCPKCADEWLAEMVRARVGSRTKSGIHLPVGVTDPAKESPSFRDVPSNRAMRRATKRSEKKWRTREKH